MGAVMSNQVFVACPIGDEGSEIRRNSDQLLKYIIEPVCQSLDLPVLRADQIIEPHRITLQIANSIANSNVMIADLTTLNPNVMYEIGIRHGLNLPMIYMATKGTRLPFDLGDFRTIFYALELDAVESAKQAFLEQIRSISDGRHSSAGMPFSQNVGNSEDIKIDLLLRAIEDNKAAVDRLAQKVEENNRSIDFHSKKQEELAGIQLMSSMIGKGIDNPDNFGRFMDLVNNANKKED